MVSLHKLFIEIRMKKILATLLLTIFISPVFAVDYSEMSTQELIAIMGYVKEIDLKKFNHELEQRKQIMNKDEKLRYEKNLKKLKK